MIGPISNRFGVMLLSEGAGKRVEGMEFSRASRIFGLIGLVAAAVLLSACAGKPAPLSASSSFSETPSFVAAEPEAASGTAEAQEMQSLIDEATRIVLSDAFARNLSSIDQPIALSPFGPRVTASTVLTLLQGRDPAYQYVPTRVRWISSGGNSNIGTGAGSIVNLTNEVRSNWQSDDPRRRSLSINSMAHELSHSLSHKSGRLDYVFTDKFFSLYFVHRSRAIASYTIGTVAQCTWLAETEPDLILNECYGRYGLRNFTPMP